MKKRQKNYYDERDTVGTLLLAARTNVIPVRIEVIMGDAGDRYKEARHMENFVLAKRCGFHDKSEQERLLKYYKDAPVRHKFLCPDVSGTDRRQMILTGVCLYKDIRKGRLAETADKDKRKKLFRGIWMNIIKRRGKEKK